MELFEMWNIEIEELIDEEIELTEEEKEEIYG